MTDATSITTGSLIAGQKVKGTTVFNLAGEKLGTVDDIMIDKVSGRAIYAVMSFGGFLGMGEKFHPLPWATLKYDHQKLSLIHISEPTRRTPISYAVFCLKKKK